MDFSFHLQQGQHLLEKQDAQSIKKALEHFRKANEMTEEDNIAKPKILYHLALGNYVIGNIEHSFRIAHKAKRSIDTAIRNSIFSMNNMRQMLGEGDIDALINHISDKFPQVVLFVDAEDEDFDENQLDFSLLHQLYGTANKEEIKPQFTLGGLKGDTLLATFAGLGRTNEELVYFDKMKGDVLMLVEGYFTSLLGDQSIANRRLADRITRGEPRDFVDEDRYTLIDRIKLSEFLSEYKVQAKGIEPFTSFIDYFSVQVLKDYTYNEKMTIDDLGITHHVQQKFHELFSQKYPDRALELRDNYTRIFQDTCKALAFNWIKLNVPGVEGNTSSISKELDFEFASSDHLRYENGVHVSGPHGGARRLIKVEPNIEGRAGYTVTLYNLDGNHPLWRNNVQMAPKQMKVMQQEPNRIILRGYGYDAMGSSFADYGLTINLNNGTVENCVLHMHDRGVDIKYLL